MLRSVDADVDASYLRETVAAVIYQRCRGKPWNAASADERCLFLTSANAAILVVVDAIDQNLQINMDSGLRH
jgi:isopentenyl diphosphate isomerase/L-lactate dehydrogenase-like FMN-dependent dehydrogenase